jgi:nucleotide-binding universal stress UspA family protein
VRNCEMCRPATGVRAALASSESGPDLRFSRSGRRDLNPRPLDPQSPSTRCRASPVLLTRHLSCAEPGLASAGVAWDLSALAPLLAPLFMPSFAWLASTRICVKEPRALWHVVGRPHYSLTAPPWSLPPRGPGRARTNFVVSLDKVRVPTRGLGKCSGLDHLASRYREQAMSTEPGKDHRIVVGVDGSLAAQQALAWAVRQAELTGASVEAVIAWHYPVVIGGMPYPPLAVLEEADFGRFATITLSDAISAAVPKDTPVRVSPAVREGNAAQVLLDAANNADLLVVGSRGHGGFAGALLGSVSQHCVHHAPCPVVIIRSEKAGRLAD